MIVRFTEGYNPTPVNIALSPDGGRLYVSSFDATPVIDTGTNTLVDAIPTRSDYLAFTPDRRRIYATTRLGELKVIDTTGGEFTVPDFFQLGSHAWGIAITPTDVARSSRSTTR